MPVATLQGHNQSPEELVEKVADEIEAYMLGRVGHQVCVNAARAAISAIGSALPEAADLLEWYETLGESPEQPRVYTRQLPDNHHERDCAYVVSDGPAPCTCGYYDREQDAIDEISRCAETRPTNSAGRPEARASANLDMCPHGAIRGSYCGYCGMVECFKHDGQRHHIWTMGLASWDSITAFIERDRNASPAQEQSALPDKLIEALMDARAAIASLPEDALGMDDRQNYLNDPQPPYPIRDELLSKIDQALRSHVSDGGVS